MRNQIGWEKKIGGPKGGNPTVGHNYKHKAGERGTRGATTKK